MLSVADIIAESSDVGAIKVAMRLGNDRFYKYIRAFGFGQHTGIELPGETRGLTKPVDALVEEFRSPPSPWGRRLASRRCNSRRL